jgi:putative ABC transport system permease protein
VLSALDGALEDTFKIMGTDILYVDKWDWAGGGNWKTEKQRKVISLQQAKEFCSRIKSAEVAIPLARNHGIKLKYNGESLTGVSIQGTKSDYSKTSGGTIIQGRFFSTNEDISGANVVVLGYGINKTLFPNNDCLGKEIKIEGHKYTIIGVVKKQSTMLMDFLDNQVYVPIQAFVNTFGDYGRSISIAVKAHNLLDLDEVRAETEGLMKEIRNIKPGNPNDFAINETKAFEKTVEKLRLYVWGIGIGMTILSFIVGIIGIMNIMFVSVAERTKEIGIRKAIGAPNRSILYQFLIESSVLCLMGAFVSFVLCSTFVFLVATILPKLVPSMSFLSPIMPYDLLIIASVVSIFVGVLAGLIPAMRASKLNPVDALRYE